MRYMMDIWIYVSADSGVMIQVAADRLLWRSSFLPISRIRICSRDIGW